jgi:hypothetical protein
MNTKGNIQHVKAVTNTSEILDEAKILCRKHFDNEDPNCIVGIAEIISRYVWN